MGVFLMMIPAIIMGYVLGRIVTLEDGRSNIYVAWYKNDGEDPHIEVFRDEDTARIYFQKYQELYDKAGLAVKTHDGKDLSL